MDVLYQAGAHMDHVNDKGQTPFELIPPDNVGVVEHFKEILGVRSFKCICARLTQREKLYYDDILSKVLTHFVQKH